MVAFNTLKQSVLTALFRTGSTEKILLTQPQQDQCVISVQEPVQIRPGLLHTSASVTRATRTTNRLHRGRCDFHDKSVDYFSILTFVSVNATAQRFIFFSVCVIVWRIWSFKRLLLLVRFRKENLLQMVSFFRSQVIVLPIQKNSQQLTLGLKTFVYA